VEVIREAVARGGDFLGHPSTAAHYRRAFWMPQIFEHSMVKAWQSRGEPDARAEARARVRHKLAGYAYQLPADKDRELTALYEQAWERLVGGR
jgi:trimethylamine:corrinoid methyltransferase-like protein